MTMRNTPARNSAPRKASRPMNSSAAIILIHPPRLKPSSVFKASKAPVLLAATLISGDLRMISRRQTNMGITEIWRALRGTSSGSLGSPLGMTWKILRTYWERALLSCKVSTPSEAHPPSFLLLLTSRHFHRCYKELPARLGCVHLLPSFWGKQRNTVQESSRDPWSIYSVLGLRGMMMEVLEH